MMKSLFLETLVQTTARFLTFGGSASVIYFRRERAGHDGKNRNSTKSCKFHLVEVTPNENNG